MNKLIDFIKNNMLFKSIFGLCSAFLMILFVSYAFFGVTLGWFSTNQEVSANGMNVSAHKFDIQVQYYYSYSNDVNATWILVDKTLDGQDYNWDDVFVDLIPGKSVYIRAIYTSNETAPYVGNTYFVPGSEVPFEEEDPDSGNTFYYYLGSQLYLSTLKIGAQEKITYDEDADKFLLPYTLCYPDATAPVLNFNKAVTASNTTICDNFTVPAKVGDTPGTITLEFSIRFTNLEANQNNYKYQYFSMNNGKCSRMIHTDFNEYTE